METKKNKIRDFVYIDIDRLYSLYSQVFEGVAEQVVQSYIDSLTSKNAQKGSFKLGSNLEEQVGEISNRTESKILYDHMYNQLKSKIQDSILNVTNICLSNYSELLSETFMIKVCGCAEIEDYERIRMFTDKFNSLAEAIAYAGIHTNEAKQAINQLETLLQTTKNASEKTNLKGQLRKFKDAKLLAKEMGLSQDDKMLGYLKEFIDMFYPGGFEITIIPNQVTSSVVFRGVVDRQLLRVKPDLLRALYGGFAKFNWTMVGQITFLPTINLIASENELPASSYDTDEKNI